MHAADPHRVLSRDEVSAKTGQGGMEGTKREIGTEKS